MKTFLTAISGIAMATMAVAPASAQSILDRLSKALQLPSGSQQTSTRSSGDGGQFAASLSAEQSAQIDALLAQPLEDQAIVADRAEAAPLIKRVLTIASCARISNAWNAANRDSLSPQTHRDPFSSHLVPMENLDYHDRNQCLDVVRLTDWSKPANNALEFRAYYVSESSGEGKRQKFVLQKMSDRWLIREIGVGLH